MERRMLLAAIGSGSLTHNLELEGSLSAITTNAQLATFLGVALSKIRTFTNTGTVIHVNIRGNYSVPTSKFLNNTSLTKIKDVGGIINTIATAGIRNTQINELHLDFLTEAYETSLAYNVNLINLSLPKLVVFKGGVFSFCPNLKTVSCPNVVEIAPTSNILNFFANLTSLELFDFKKLKVLGDNPAGTNSGYRGGFDTVKLGCVFNVNVFMKTNNAGGPQYLLTYLKNNRGATINFYNDDGSYHSTL